MKNKLLALAILLISGNLFAQASKYSIGLVGTHFHNDSYDNRISEIENPFGYGLILTNQLTEDFSIGLTAEYIDGNFQDNKAHEKDARFHFLGILHPIKTKYIQPYFAGGFVYTHRMINFNSSEKSDYTKDILSGRLSVGINVPIISTLYINGDLGMYTNGYGYIGWGSNLGFRVGI
jgi:hypothetical protein